VPDRSPTRRAGIGRLADGATVVWSVADGRRGRRWREVVVGPGGGIRSSLLLETDPDGWFSHLELSTVAGLLTLHPEGDGTIHGNTVTGGGPGIGAGVWHVAGLPWGRDDALVIDGSALASAAVARSLLARQAEGTVVEWPGIAVDLDLAVHRRSVRVERRDPGHWRIATDDPLEIDGDGVPLLAEARTWPLELDDRVERD
jgi:hypothetical protein